MAHEESPPSDSKGTQEPDEGESSSQLSTTLPILDATEQEETTLTDAEYHTDSNNGVVKVDTSTQVATVFKAPVTRRNHGNGHSYRDANGHKVPGVTTIIREGYPKGALLGWAARVSAECVVNEWDALNDMKPSERMEYVRNANVRARNSKGVRGTALHKLAVPLTEGKEVKIPDEQTELVESYVAFLDDFRVVPLHSEFTVVSITSGYAGTGDLICDMWDDEEKRMVRWLIDIKTSKGVYADNALQLVAYRYADYIVLSDKSEVRMPEVERTGIVHIRLDGYDLVPIVTNHEVFRYWQYLRQMYDFVTGYGKELIGEPLPHPDHDEEVNV